MRRRARKLLFAVTFVCGLRCPARETLGTRGPRSEIHQNLAICQWMRHAHGAECEIIYSYVLDQLPQSQTAICNSLIFKMTLQLPRRRAKYGAPRPGGARWAAHRRAGRRASTAVRPTAGGAAPQVSGRRSSRPRQAGATGTQVRVGAGVSPGVRVRVRIRIKVRGFGFGLEVSGSVQRIRVRVRVLFVSVRDQG